MGVIEIQIGQNIVEDFLLDGGNVNIIIKNLRIAIQNITKPLRIINVCSWLVHAQKCSNYALTNLLFDLCKFI
jgi:hypothetical protein